MKYILLIFILTNNVEVDINMLKLVYLAELVDINLKYIASNASVMMSLSVGYPQISASGYPDSKFIICFSPSLNNWFSPSLNNWLNKLYTAPPVDLFKA